MPRPFAAYAPATLTIGSASKSVWGGLRLGWIRAPHRQMEALTRARLGLDLGALTAEETYARLVERRGWPLEDYIAWTTSMLIGQILT